LEFPGGSRIPRDPPGINTLIAPQEMIGGLDGRGLIQRIWSSDKGLG